MNENKEVKEKVVLVAVSEKQKSEETLISVNELEELVKTAGGVVVDKILQERENIDSKSYIGSGKVFEVEDSVCLHEADTVIANDELTSIQLKNLEEGISARVIDRTSLILDIFAKHAKTSEGKLQVELAQLRYRSSRLMGLGKSMSRLGGGIGTRGPGEKKLETDRRHIRKRIGLLKEELDNVKRHRDMLRENRKKKNQPVIAIAGYTNAGKSTLLNALCDSDVLMADKLFATLDPTTRQLVLPEGKEIYLTDTVGFIERLPHHLVKAFSSTLEEVAYSDIIIHVIDCSDPNMEMHVESVYETLESLNADDIPVLTVFNKIDKTDLDCEMLRDSRSFETVCISAKNGTGIEELIRIIEKKLKEGLVHIKTIIPYSKGNIVQNIRANGQLIEERFEAEGTYIEAYLDEALVNKYGIKID